MTSLPMMLMSDDEIARFGRRADQSFGALQTARGLLPLVAMDVDARVAGVMAGIEIAQRFVNTTGTAIEATYIFPLPDRAAVHRFRMEVGGRIVEGVVEERGKAREQYDEAIALGHRAAITEEERAGVFTLRVGNLMPGDVATIRLSLVGPLPVDDGEVTFQFPLVVAPRYMPGAALGGDQAGLGVAPDTSLVPDASRISPPVLLPGCPNPVRLGIRIALEDHHIRDVASSLHAVTSSHRDAHVVEIQPGERLDRDFILRWRIDGAALRSSLVCADDTDGKGGTFMLTLVPPSTTTIAARPRDVVFVIDRSGSMGGWKMVAARRAAARMIDSLTSRDRFCAIAFDDQVDFVPHAAATGLIAATDRHRFQAVEALSKIDARGGTELSVPLKQAAQMLSGYDDRERVIVLVTDGQVGNEDSILRELAPQLHKIRMFSLGIDQAVNAAFLRRLAAAGGGLCELVESEDRLDAVMSKVHRRIGTPIASELSVVGPNLDLDPASITPGKLPDVYAGAPVTILGRYRGRAPAKAAVEIVGSTFGDPLREHIGRGPDLHTAPWFAASWARARIRDLEDRYAAGERGGVEHEIVTLSTRFQVLSRFTAFLAVDRSAVVNPGGGQKSIVQAVEQPAGWGDVDDKSGSHGAPRRKAASTVVTAARPGPPRASANKMGAPMGRPAPGPAPAPASAPSPAGGYGGARAYPMPMQAPMAQKDADMDFDDSCASEINDPFALSSNVGGMPAMAPPPPPQPMPIAPAPGGFPPPMANAPAPKREAAASRSAEVAPAYIVSLATLARELDVQGRGRADGAAIRVLRQRLTEWIEDVRSVGGNDDLAYAVEKLVHRLSSALSAGTTLAAEAVAIAGELAGLAAGAPPPPRKASRLAFWK